MMSRDVSTIFEQYSGICAAGRERLFRELCIYEFLMKKKTDVIFDEAKHTVNPIPFVSLNATTI